MRFNSSRGLNMVRLCRAERLPPGRPPGSSTIDPMEESQGRLSTLVNPKVDFAEHQGRLPTLGFTKVGFAASFYTLII